jgi:hypothetical protein
MDELPEQPRLAGSRLTLERDDLPLPGRGAREHRGKSETLLFPAHVRGEAAAERHLETTAHGALAQKLEHLDGRRHALDGDGSERSHVDVAVDEPQRGRGQEDAAGEAACSIRAARWVVWPIAV